MQSTHLRHDEETVRLAENKEDLVLLQQHLKEVIEGAAFRGSHRSGQFLKYIVEQAIAGRFEGLKERVIGVELFGRSPSYDTGDDAIVRVTASDVRKRLLQHYGRYGTTSQFRINLPLGSYVPEITRDNHQSGNESLSTPSPAASAVAVQETTLASSAAPAESDTSQNIQPPKMPAQDKDGHRARRPWPLLILLVVTALNMAIWGIFWIRSSNTSTPAGALLPWSAFFNSPHGIRLLTSDPDIAELQQYVGGEISASDYANHNLIPTPNKMSPEVQHFWDAIRKDDKAAFVDAKLAARIAELTETHGKRLDVRPARDLQISDLQTDDNFIFLGSPRSNPWSELFSDQLDFRFAYDKASGQEIIRNIHPRPDEAQSYVPTALGGATGESFAIVALVRHPDQSGQILLIAGTNAEGTEAAGRLITDMSRLSTALRACGISPNAPLKHFELLLKVKTMAGSPNDERLVACHILSDSPN